MYYEDQITKSMICPIKIKKIRVDSKEGFEFLINRTKNSDPYHISQLEKIIIHFENSYFPTFNDNFTYIKFLESINKSFIKLKEIKIINPEIDLSWISLEMFPKLEKIKLYGNFNPMILNTIIHKGFKLLVLQGSGLLFGFKCIYLVNLPGLDFEKHTKIPHKTEKLIREHHCKNILYLK